MEALSFDDVLLVPRRSDIFSRKDISIASELFADWTLEIPIISANMPSVTGVDMAIEMDSLGAFSILPRFNETIEAVADFNQVLNARAVCGVSLGLGDETMHRFYELYSAGARIFCIDVAHGHHDRVINLISELKEADVKIIAGNVATEWGAYDLAEAGADAIKVGVGPGAACTTREVTGFGIPQLSAIIDTSQVKNDFPDVRIIADGGIKNSGDIVKALAFGADTVMIGRLLAETREAPFPGEYFGNASSKVREYRAPEGVHIEVHHGKKLEDVIKNLAWGVKSGLSYAGVNTVFDLHEYAVEYVQVTPQTMVENGTR